MDGRVVYEKYHGSPVVATVTSYLEDQLVDEVLEHGCVDASFDQLNGQDLLLSDGC
jgi:hypothetical protein